MVAKLSFGRVKVQRTRRNGANTDMLEGSRFCRGIRLVEYCSLVLRLAIRYQVEDLLDLHLFEVLLQFGVIEHAHIVGPVRVV